MEKSDFVLQQLRIVYPGYMLCHQSVTQQDLVSFTTGIQDSTPTGNTYRSYVRAKSSIASLEDQSSESKEDLTRKASPLPVDSSTTPTSAEKSSPVVWVPKQTGAALDTSKYELVLPANFAALNNELKEYIMYLMTEKTLMPHQLTVVLCRVLALVTTENSKRRAKKVLLTLSSHPGVQLTNMDKVARYIAMGEIVENQDKSPSTTKKQQTTNQPLQENTPSPTTQQNVVVQKILPTTVPKPQQNQVAPSSAAGPLIVNTSSTSPLPKAVIRHERSFSAGNEISPQLVDYYYEKEQSFKDVVVEDDSVLVSASRKLSLTAATKPKFARSSPTTTNNAATNLIPSPVNRKYNSFEKPAEIEAAESQSCIHVIHHHHHYYHNLPERASSKSDASDSSDNSTTAVLPKQLDQSLMNEVDSKKQAQGTKKQQSTSTKSVDYEPQDDVPVKLGFFSCWSVLFRKLRETPRSSRCSREDIELQ